MIAVYKAFEVLLIFRVLLQIDDREAEVADVSAIRLRLLRLLI